MFDFVFSIASRKRLTAYAQTLPPSQARAQCYQLARLKGDGSIAQAIKDNHVTMDGALRAASLVVNAGIAKETHAKQLDYYGTFVFEDESTLN